MDQVSHHHHHHHHSSHRHHHHSNRSRRMKLAFKRGLLFGVSTIAVLVTNVIVNYGMSGRDDLLPELMRLAPTFIGIGIAVWLVYYFWQRIAYYIAHKH